MSKHATPSSDTRPEEKRGKGLIWQVVLVNSSALILSTGVSLQRDLMPQTTFALIALTILLVNGALWMGRRIAREQRKTNRSLKPVFFFVIGALAAIDAVVDATSNDYGSAVFALLCCIGMVGSGAIVLKKNATRGAGGSQER